MTTTEFRAILPRLYPAFGPCLVESFFAQDDGGFTPHGLCSEFSHYFYDDGSACSSSP